MTDHTPKAEMPGKLYAYKSIIGDWWAAEEKNFRPNMLAVSEDARTPYVPEAKLEKALAALREARAILSSDSSYNDSRCIKCGRGQFIQADNGFWFCAYCKRLHKGTVLNPTRTRLTYEQVREIKFFLKMGKGTTFIAKKYKVTHDCIWKIKHGLTWKHVRIED